MFLIVEDCIKRKYINGLFLKDRTLGLAGVHDYPIKCQIAERFV